MASKLPPDFDPDRYCAEYPDVALSGMTPVDHYLLFGRIMGRRLTRSRERPIAPAPVEAEPDQAHFPVTPAPKPPKTKPKATKPAEPRADEKPQPPKQRAKPIIDRPADFEPEQALIRPAPPRLGADEHGSIALGTLAEGLSRAVSKGLAAYERMFGLGKGDSAFGLGATQLLDGPTRLENAWLTGDSVLRLMITDHDRQADGWAVRAYQAAPAEPAQLQLLAPGAVLPKCAPALVEFKLRDRLMPLLVELAGDGGGVRGLALLPFPSLLPGGLHNAELRALQSGASPIDAFWSLSDLLLRELIGDARPAEFSIGRLSHPSEETRAGEIEQWLSALLGFQRFEDGKTLMRPGGAELQLPPNCIPTIGGLVSRSLDAHGTSPYLVSDSETFRPRWSVVLPATWDAQGRAPVLTGARRNAAPPVHLGIALSTPPAPSLAAVPARKDRAARKLSVLLDATDPERSKDAVAALRSTLGPDLDLSLHLRGEEAAFRATIDGGWTLNADLQSAAASAKHDLLLTISDQVDLGDNLVLDTLTAMLEDEKVASASCVLLREVSLKKQKVLQPATGGLFPAGVSFATSPSLSFAEPDVLEALPETTYPVAANTLLLTLWRAGALASLPRSTRPLPENALDIHLGLALAERGLVSLCTTKVSARLNGDYTPRDAIDPIGQSRLAPQDWQQLLGRVTLLRQLF